MEFNTPLAWQHGFDFLAFYLTHIYESRQIHTIHMHECTSILMSKLET